MNPGVTDEPAYQLDVVGLAKESEISKSGSRPWVGIRFNCCDVYVRIYRNAEGTAYTGRCPKCLRPVRLRVGAGGTSSRFFNAE